MGRRHILHFLVIIIALVELISSIEIYENVPLKNPGKLYLKEIFAVNVFCKEDELNLYYRLEEYLEIKSKIEVIVDSANKSCPMLIQSEKCFSIVWNLSSYAHELEQISSVIRKLSRTDNNYELISNEIKNFDQIEPNLGYTQSDIDMNLLNLAKTLNYVKVIFNRKPLDDKFLGILNGLKYISAALNQQLLTYRYILHIIQDKTYYDVTSLVSLEFLKNKIDKIDERITRESCTIPKVTNHITEVLKLLEIVKYDACLTKDFFVLYMKIPTIYSDKYLNYQTISLPFTSKNESFVIPPKNPFYLVSIDSDKPKASVFPLSQKEKNECKESNFGKICFPSKPMELIDREYTQNRQFLPQIELCSNATDSTPFFSENKCNKISIAHKNKLIKLSEDTYYAYIVNASEVEIYCKHHNDTEILNESKIFGVLKHCTIKLGRYIVPEDEETYMKDIISQSTSYEKSNTKINSTFGKAIRFTMAKMPFILMVLSWLLLAFLIFNLLIRISKMKPCENHVTYTRAPKIDFVCSFKFDKPQLPPRSYKSSDLSDFAYDSPKSSRSLTDYDLKIHKKLGTKARYSSNSNSSSFIDDSILYSDINKNPKFKTFQEDFALYQEVNEKNLVQYTEIDQNLQSKPLE